MTSVAEIMSRGVVSVEAAAPITVAARLMNDRRVGAVLVLDDDRLTGILSERDVLRAVALGGVETSSVGDWMTHHPETVAPSESTGHAAVLMIHGGFRHLPVVDGETVVGIISIRDLVRVTLADEVPRGA